MHNDYHARLLDPPGTRPNFLKCKAVINIEVEVATGPQCPATAFAVGAKSAVRGT